MLNCGVLPVPTWCSTRITIVCVNCSFFLILGNQSINHRSRRVVILFHLTQDVILQLSLGARGVLNPVCATMGGIVGQEVLKACSGKFR